MSVTAGGAITGFSFAPGTAADLSAPTSLPVHLLALEHSARTATSDDAALRAAIVNVASHYLRLAQTKTPAEMEALIWGEDSVDGADHGPSCAAFASLTLELAAQAVGQQSWVTGGSTYPWPLHDWADVRVDPNPGSLNVTSVLQDAQAHDRWHPLGDRYPPRPGDWVLFDGHVEVVTSYTGGVLHTIGGDSLPNYSVNAHTYSGSLADAGIAGFVDNGNLAAASGNVKSPGTSKGTGTSKASNAPAGGTATTATGSPDGTSPSVTGASSARQGVASIPGAVPASSASAGPAPKTGVAKAGTSRTGASKASGPSASAQHAFINEVAPGAMATQREYGVPAAVTIAQAIEESGWGQSELAVKAHNLFGIKGTGPAGSVSMPTSEYENGQWVATTASFRAYHNVAQSISDHGRLLATNSAYSHAMADRSIPDAFAADLAGVYATDPGYGGQLVALMRLYDLYRYDTSSATGGSSSAPASHTPAKSGSAAHTPVAATTSGSASVPATGGTATAASAHGGSVIPGASGEATVSTSAAVTTSRGTGGSRASEDPSTVQSPRITLDARVTPKAHLARDVKVNRSARNTQRAQPARERYLERVPLAVATAFLSSAKAPIARAEPLYRDVAEIARVPWELLAACDWMQCEARLGYSPVRGEKIGKTNSDGTAYHTKSEALGQCAADLIGLAAAVYGIDLTTRGRLSVHELAKAFAAFRWGGLLRKNRISAMEFPYSVAGLTAEHTKMCWPKIPDPNVPDKPGARFRGAFGAVPIVLTLDYPATV